MSKGEEKITDLLNLDKYKFVREKTFSDLKGGRFRYDFYVKDVHGADCIIEFNGEQHYHFVKKFYKTEREWRTAQEHDRRKISYALANNIPIYIIPFWELPKITSAQQLFQDKYRARTRWKNDEEVKNSPLYRNQKI
jgi:hypothetical protein